MTQQREVVATVTTTFYSDDDADHEIDVNNDAKRQSLEMVAFARVFYDLTTGILASEAMPCIRQLVAAVAKIDPDDL